MHHTIDVTDLPFENRRKMFMKRLHSVLTIKYYNNLSKDYHNTKRYHQNNSSQDKFESSFADFHEKQPMRKSLPSIRLKRGVSDLSKNNTESPKSSAYHQKSENKKNFNNNNELEESKIFTNNEDSFNQNLKYFVGKKNLLKLRNFIRNKDITKSEDEFVNSITESKFHEIHIQQKYNEERKKPKGRFKRAVRLMFCLLKVLKIHRVSQEVNFLFSLKFTQIQEEKNVKEKSLFDKDYYKRPKELTLPDEAKKMLALDPEDRTEEMIKTIIISLNFSVPEFSDFPIYMQRQIARLGIYQEFEPGRVIIRQGHKPHNYYIVVAGAALVIIASKSSSDDLSYKPIVTLKAGDAFGEMSIINNTNRAATITAVGNKKLGLLLIDKKDFFLIQAPVISDSDRVEFLKNKIGILKNCVDYPYDELKAQSKHSSALVSVFYRKGMVVCNNSIKDDWLYVIKSGSCRVFKKIRFDETALKAYYEHLKNKKMIKLNRTENLYDLEKRSVYLTQNRNNLKETPFTKYSFAIENDKLVTYLEVNRLKEGDIFGLHDLISDDKSSPLILVSEGIQCILINRLYFLQHLSPENKTRIKYALQLYPDDSYFIRKYFDAFLWKNYASICQIDTLNKLKVRKEHKISTNIMLKR